MWGYVSVPMETRDYGFRSHWGGNHGQFWAVPCGCWELNSDPRKTNLSPLNWSHFSSSTISKSAAWTTLTTVTLMHNNKTYRTVFISAVFISAVFISTAWFWYFSSLLCDCSTFMKWIYFNPEHKTMALSHWRQPWTQHKQGCVIKDYETGRKTDFFKMKTGSFKLIKLLKCLGFRVSASPDLNHDLHLQRHHKITFVITQTDGFTVCGVFSKIKTTHINSLFLLMGYQVSLVQSSTFSGKSGTNLINFVNKC